MKLAIDIARHRDKVCQVCGKSDGKLDVHHIIDRKYCPFNLKNLILLCPSHHAFGYESFHKHPVWASAWLKHNRPPTYYFCLNFVYKRKGWDYFFEYNKLLNH